MKAKLMRFMVASTAIAILFWLSFGHNLKFCEFQSGDICAYEEFPLNTRIIVTLLISAIGGFIVLGTAFLINKIKNKTV
jgi:hypothetical protein